MEKWRNGEFYLSISGDTNHEDGKGQMDFILFLLLLDIRSAFRHLPSDTRFCTKYIK
jgi:hypothetical protein